MKSTEEYLAGWVCEACVSPGRCIVYDKKVIAVDGGKTGTACLVQPWGCTYHNNYVKPVWKPLTVGELKRMVK